MIVKKEYKDRNVIKYTTIDDIDRIDEGVLENGNTFINIYKISRKKDDDFETIEVDKLNIYIMSDDGKTLSIHRSK